MPGIERLHLDDAFEDSPQTRSLLSVFEEDVNQLKKYAKILNQCCRRIYDAESELTMAIRGLSQHVRAYEHVKFPLEHDSESILATTMKQFSHHLDDLSSWHHILATQLHDGMMFPINRFVESDLAELGSMQDLFHSSTSDLEKSYGKYSKLSRKKENEKEKQEIQDDLFLNRKKFHQVAMHYYANLNGMQYKRKVALVEPIVGFLHSFKDHFTLGNEAMNSGDTEEFILNLNASVLGVKRELDQETIETASQINKIAVESEYLYPPEPIPDSNCIPANTTLTQKCGYLNLRSKVAGVMSKWDRSYFFTQGGNLMSMCRGDVVGSLVIELDSSVSTQFLDNEDRRFVFQVSNNLKTVVLQALNEKEREEWIATIHNIILDGGYVKDLPGDQGASNFATALSRRLSTEAIPIPKVNLPDRDQEQHKLLRSGSGPPPNPPPTPIDNAYLPKNPISFDLISQPKTITAGQSPDLKDAADSGEGRESFTFYEMYSARFLGSMEVKYDRGDQLIHEVIRQIMAARAIHNVFKMTELHLVITNKSLRLLDPGSDSVLADFPLQEVSFWAVHKENERLLGFIFKMGDSAAAADSDQIPRFMCQVFECNASGKEICSVLQAAAKLALQELMEKRKLQKFAASRQQSKGELTKKSSQSESPK